MTDESLVIGTAGLTASISPLGAELQTLRDANGRDLLWSGDPEIWAGRAPILFPIVGELRGGQYRVDETTYALARHGFARRSRFRVIERTATAATFRLEADDTTRAAYPFEFRLDLRFAISGSTLEIAATVSNRGEARMPASFGFHPALRWPLPYGAPRDAHRLLFAEPEYAPIRRLDAAGLFDPRPRPTPIIDRELVLHDGLFTEDAMILDRPAARSLLYGARSGPQIRVDYPNMPMLGLWSKPGAGYVCIEPWHGLADPAGFERDIFSKPGVVALPPGEAATFNMALTLLDVPKSDA